MTVELRLSSRQTLGGVIVAVLLSSSRALAGDLEDGIAAYTRQDYARALALLAPLAEQGVARAQTMLGAMYLFGNGVPHDDAQAMKWTRKPAELGDAKAQFGLGWMYETGQGATQDYAEAVKWYRKAADQGLKEAQGDLGRMYGDSLGPRRPS